MIQQRHISNNSVFRIFLFTQICFLFLSSCTENKKIKAKEVFNIDPKIKVEVEKNISSIDLDLGIEGISVYNNRVYLDFYEDGKQILSNTNKNESSIFRSSYYWMNDTLVIDGLFGLFGGSGFTIKMINDDVVLYHLLASDESPSYAHTAKSPLVSRLEVPCTASQVILSEIPDKSRQNILYGCVEFESDEYYKRSGSINGKEFPRKKQQAKMKIFFKSEFLDIDFK